MDPQSIATGIVPLFQAVYLTCRFMYRQVLIATGFHTGKANMAKSYRFQIVRLKTFWVMLTREIGPKTSISSLAGLPKGILELVRFIMIDIATGLNTYSSVAREMDEEYTEYSTEKAFVLTDTSKTLLELPLDLDDATGLTDRERNAEKLLADEPLASDAKPRPGQHGILARIFRKSQDEKPAEKTRLGLKGIPQAFSWCFDEPQLRKSLKVLSGKIDDLERLGPYLVASLEQDSTIRRKLETPESGSAFRDYRGHLLLQKKAEDIDAGLKVNDVEPTPWNVMKAYIDDSRQASSRILIERKETGNFPRSSMVPAAVKERAAEITYAPRLASLLMAVGQAFTDRATLGMLPFKGFSKDPAAGGCFSYAFDFPRGTLDRKPLSLHDLISSDERTHKLSLTTRFQIAKIVSRCLGTLYSDGWLHKGVSSRAVNFFFRQTDKTAFLDTTAPYLTNFDFARPAYGVYSAVLDGASVSRNLDLDVYRHPKRFGVPQEYYNMMHDVYSLGVVLLEIGLWKTARRIYDEDLGSKKTSDVTGQDVREVFMKRAREELDHRMGPAYRDAVVTCLDGDQLSKHLVGKHLTFAVEFQKNVVQKVDIAVLNPVGTDYLDGDSEPPRYEDVVPAVGVYDMRN